MKNLALLGALATLAHLAPAQSVGTVSAQSAYVGVGVTSLSGYYTGANEGVSGVRFAPTVLGSVKLSSRVALRGSVAYQRQQVDRDESSPQTRFVQHQRTKNLVVPVAMQVTLNQVDRRFQVALLGGLTFWHIDDYNQFTYYYYYPNTPEAVVPTTREDKRLDTFLTGGASASYQLTPKWIALTDVTVSGRIGGEKKLYYEYLPSVGLTLGVGYCLNKAN